MHAPEPSERVQLAILDADLPRPLVHGIAPEGALEATAVDIGHELPVHGEPELRLPCESPGIARNEADLVLTVLQLLAVRLGSVETQGHHLLSIDVQVAFVVDGADLGPQRGSHDLSSSLSWCEGRHGGPVTRRSISHVFER